MKILCKYEVLPRNWRNTNSARELDDVCCSYRNLDVRAVRFFNQCTNSPVVETTYCSVRCDFVRLCFSTSEIFFSTYMMDFSEQRICIKFSFKLLKTAGEIHCILVEAFKDNAKSKPFGDKIGRNNLHQVCSHGKSTLIVSFDIHGINTDVYKRQLLWRVGLK